MWRLWSWSRWTSWFVEWRYPSWSGSASSAALSGGTQWGLFLPWPHPPHGATNSNTMSTGNWNKWPRKNVIITFKTSWNVFNLITIYLDMWISIWNLRHKNMICKKIKKMFYFICRWEYIFLYSHDDENMVLLSFAARCHKILHIITMYFKQ